MSEIPPPPPPASPPPPLPPDYNYGYYAPPDNAPKLVRLAVIFNYIAGGIDAATVLICGGVGLFFLLAGPSVPRDPGDPSPVLLGSVYLTIGALSIGYAIVKFIAARKLQTFAPNARKWGLVAGIVGAAQLLCGNCCLLQVAAGIYTIVVMNFANVRQYLSAPASEPTAPSQYPSGPFA